MIVAVGSFVLADFGTEPKPAVAAAAGAPEAAETPADEGAGTGA